MTSSLNSKYFLYMIKTTHLSDEPKLFNMSLIDLIAYPDVYVKKDSEKEDRIEAILQIKLKHGIKDKVLRDILGDNNYELIEVSEVSTKHKGTKAQGQLHCPMS